MSVCPSGRGREGRRGRGTRPGHPFLPLPHRRMNRSLMSGCSFSRTARVQQRRQNRRRTRTRTGFEGTGTRGEGSGAGRQLPRCVSRSDLRRPRRRRFRPHLGLDLLSSRLGLLLPGRARRTRRPCSRGERGRFSSLLTPRIPPSVARAGRTRVDPADPAGAKKHIASLSSVHANYKE